VCLRGAAAGWGGGRVQHDPRTSRYPMPSTPPCPRSPPPLLLLVGDASRVHEAADQPTRPLPPSLLPREQAEQDCVVGRHAPLAAWGHGGGRQRQPGLMASAAARPSLGCEEWGHTHMEIVHLVRVGREVCRVSRVQGPGPHQPVRRRGVFRASRCLEPHRERAAPLCSPWPMRPACWCG
jgi:hypothetical protein